MSRPEPLPGTHLARVDCVGCGVYVLAIPEYADVALCTGCAREKAGCLEAAGPPESWFGLSESTPVVPLSRPAPSGERGDVRVVCPTCRWRYMVEDPADAAAVLALHRQVRHDPKGWLSGVAGGLTDRRFRN